MKNLFISVLLVIVLLGLAACAQPVSGEVIKSDKERVSTPEVSQTDLTTFVAGNSDFAFDLYQTLKNTDGKPGCDTWVLGMNGNATSSSVWLEKTVESDDRFHVSTVIGDYISPFPIATGGGTLTQIRTAMGPDGTTPLGDCTVSKIRLAIGNWGPGGPKGPVICYVDHLICNGRLLF